MQLYFCNLVLFTKQWQEFIHFVLGKIEEIVRRNLNEIGGQEVRFNALQPKEWWLKAKRWENVDILFKLKSQIGTDYAVACTHEEQAVPVISSFVKSYKDLPSYDKEKSIFPLSIYQIQTKFRDELRAKAGLMRGREFIMKDMYDFHTNSKSQDEYYEVVKSAYNKIYQELGLKAYVVQASGGIFTSNISHEFQVECESGEDYTFIDPESESKNIFDGNIDNNQSQINSLIAYNKDMAPCKAEVFDFTSEEEKERKDEFLEGLIGVEALIKHFQIPIQKSTKTLLYEDFDGKVILACVRSDRSVSEDKLQTICGRVIKLAQESTIERVFGCKSGYAGIVNTPKGVEVYLDESIEKLKNFETGTNKTGYHSINVCFGRDIELPEKFYDLKTAQEGDFNPKTGNKWNVKKTSEIGNIFKLDDKYTKAFNMTYADKDNKLQIPLMNCYGIGVSRCIGAIAEIYNDEKGLKWPKSVSPFQFHLITQLTKDEGLNNKITDLANSLYIGKLKIVLNKATQKWTLIDPSNIEDVTYFTFEEIENMSSPNQILWDDRDGVSLGEKFKDADLIGIPYQVVITQRTILTPEKFEIKER
jgi:prolyl-tRNA synthetase